MKVANINQINTDIDFTVIIPAKNEELHLGNCLASIGSMTFSKSRYEVLVIDNGSSDRTMEIAAAMGATVYQQPGLTISGLRNFGASKAKGKVLAFLDADCTVAREWLEEAARYLAIPDIAAFGSAPVPPPEANWVQETWFHIRARKEVVEDVDWLESMNMFVPHPVFTLVGGFDDLLLTCEDYELCQRLARHGRIVSDQRIRAVHYGEADSLARFFRKERWRATSNYQGMRKRWKNVAEWPSIALPIMQLLLLAALLTALLLMPTGSVPLGPFLCFLFLWQGAFCLLAAWKIRPKRSLLTLARLAVLLNVYFLARGCAVFGGGRR